jgi:serine/threonine protein kinase
VKCESCVENKLKSLSQLESKLAETTQNWSEPFLLKTFSSPLNSIYFGDLSGDFVSIVKYDVPRNDLEQFEEYFSFIQLNPHANVTRFLFACAITTSAYLVFENSSHSLSNLPSKTEAEAKINIVIDICKAVRFFHNNGILHLNLFPQNVIFTHQHTASISHGSFLSCDQKVRMHFFLFVPIP